MQFSKKKDPPFIIIFFLVPQRIHLVNDLGTFAHQWIANV
jgi:hypothetical protein